MTEPDPPLIELGRGRLIYDKAKRTIVSERPDILERLRDLRPGYGNVVEDAISEIERLRACLQAIMKATVEGRVCDDVAWFDSITTLHDFCDISLNPSKR